MRHQRLSAAHALGCCCIAKLKSASAGIHIELPRVDCEELTDECTGEPSVTIRKRVEAARERKREHFAGLERLASNGGMGVSHTLHGT